MNPHSRARLLAVSCLALVLLFLTGCGGGPRFAPVDGQLVISLYGKAVPDAADISVQFLPDALNGTNGPTSFGTTGPDGKFTLRTVEGQEGAVVGKHRVVLADLREDRPAQGDYRPVKPSRVPMPFSIATTTITVEVTENGGPLKVEIVYPAR